MALEKAGVSLVAENFQQYMAQLSAVTKAQKEAFSNDNLKAYQDAMKKLGDAYKNIPKTIPKPDLPTPGDTNKLQEALDTLGKTGKFAISQISEETLKLKAAFDEVRKSGKFEIAKIEPIKSNILGDLTSQLDATLQRGDGFKAMFQDIGSFLGGQFISTLLKVGGVLSAVFSVNYIKDFVSGLLQTGVGMNSQFEKFQTQFTTLLGTTDAAKKRIGELAQFANVTPYELPGVVQANKLLQTFGGNALASEKNMRRIGDAAASANQPFESVAFWIGRMYTAMQSGRPFGESSARLQEMAILSGDVRNKLEEMQKTGKSGSDIWTYFSEVLDKKFGGAMDRLSKTFEGAQSTIDDFHNSLIRIATGEYFDELKKQQQAYMALISDPAMADSLNSLAEAIGHIAGVARAKLFEPFSESLKSIKPEDVKNLASSVGDIGKAMERIQGLKVVNLGDAVKSLAGWGQAFASITSIGADLDSIIQRVDKLGGAMKYTSTVANALYEGFKTFKDGLIGVVLPGYQALSLLEKAGITFDNLNQKIKAFTGKSISESLNIDPAPLTDAEHKLDALGQTIEGTLNPSTKDATNLTNDFGDAVYDTTEILQRQKEALEAQVTALEAEASAIEKAQNIQQKYQEDIAKAKTDYDKAVADASDKYTKERTRKEADFAKKMVEFEADNARKRAKMIDDYNTNVTNRAAQYNLQRAQSEQQYNQKVAQDKRKFYDDQKRALIEFQLSQTQALRSFNIQDTRMRAEGDIIGLMQAREDFANQQQTNQENFQNQQTNAKDAFSKQQEQAAENFALQEEQARQSYALQTDIQREEFQKRLIEFDDNLAIERQKRIDANTQEMIDLATKFEEEKAKLYENYQEKLVMAEEQKNKELTALGDSLKAQGTVTEEGMKKIADTVAQMFGDKGAGDQLIKGWAERSVSTVGSAVDAINAKIAEVKKQIENVGKPTETPSPGRSAGLGANPSTLANPPASATTSRPVGMRTGGSGIVTGPATFQVEPGVREHVAFTPIGTTSNLRLSGRAGIDVTGLPAGTSSEVGERLADTLVEELRSAVKRLSRRGSS